MDAKLVVVGGDAKAAEIRLKLPSVVGRGREATLTLPHPLVSRAHCELFEQDGQLVVRDLGSLNGTFIADQRITEAVLPPGELLTIGTVTFRAVYEQNADLSPPDAGVRKTEEDEVPDFVEAVEGDEPVEVADIEVLEEVEEFEVMEDEVRVQQTEKTIQIAADSTEPEPPKPTGDDDLNAFLRELDRD